ncbi:30S ribosomal protein S16 [Moraxella oblonga]|uniref:30S ribosomal protein S16 n=1 Tax=Moraxella oblonga TaxID=200413 RepID=UPI0008313B1E|nr:30S ribosomal protein S16 [Moraxella oblonga]
MVVIRMARGGAKKRPFYQIVVADKRAPRDGRHIQKIGFFNPLARGQEESFRIDLDSYNAWIAKGAKPTDRIVQLVKQAQK